MDTMMKINPLHKHLLAASFVACLGATAAVAQTTAPATGASAAKMQEHAARMQERMTQKFAELKTKPAIPAGQEAAWNPWVAAMKPPAPGSRTHVDMSTLTTPQRIDRMRTMRAERAGAMDKRADATLA